jgi:RimJ/RimL family protein N-acetyltransferase
MTEGCVFCDHDKFREAGLYFENDFCIYASTRDPRDPPDVIPGCGVIIPKAHRASPFDLTAQEWAAIRELMLLVRAELHKRLAPDGYTLGWNDQDGLHPHLHVIPRFDDEPMARHGVRTGNKAACEDEETARRFGWWPEHSTEQTVRAAYAEWAKSWRDGGPRRTFAARDPQSGALVGGCELRIRPDGTGEVSYWTHAGKRGRGYARNALALLAGYAASIGVTRLEAHIAPDNHTSRHVAESAGFTRAGTLTSDNEAVMIRYTR